MNQLQTCGNKKCGISFPSLCVRPTLSYKNQFLFSSLCYKFKKVSDKNSYFFGFCHLFVTLEET